MSLSPKLILPLIAAVTMLSACNTVAGAGNDMQRAGAAITSEARQASN